MIATRSRSRPDLGRPLPAALAGKAVLTRGYIDGTRRPTIAVTFPEQIEVLKNREGRQKKAAPKSLSGPR